MGKPIWKRPFWSGRRVESIKTNFKEIIYGDGRCRDLTQDRVQWRSYPPGPTITELVVKYGLSFITYSEWVPVCLCVLAVYECNLAVSPATHWNASLLLHGYFSSVTEFKQAVRVSVCVCVCVCVCSADRRTGAAQLTIQKAFWKVAKQSTSMCGWDQNANFIKYLPVLHLQERMENTITMTPACWYGGWGWGVVQTPLR
jgi:hypothetical protein